MILHEIGAETGLVDGATVIVSDTLKEAAVMVESGAGKAVAVGVVIVYADGSVGSMMEGGGAPFALAGGCAHLQRRILDEVV